MLNVRRLYVVVDILISAAKVCDCVISAWCSQVCDLVVELRFRQNILWQPLILFRRLYLGKATLESGKLDLGLVSADSNGIAP